ncbi:chemotaxis protein CheW [Pelagicoccus sp. SDUM812003]|uniref:chemotaxis protein CheW n=1 Tax=Pelagicoccus sp. SDUM812003 TaxID=3041267 RepID=UPI00280ED53B|nr:chemotaxis protein CheW [Pelagicoccus sp. SDUM812003]MDQ8203332.1 chemotaxis protein CheW [Pelagicoccus sp. SDUM812003]
MSETIKSTEEMMQGLHEKLEEAGESQSELDSLYGTFFLDEDEFAFHIREMQEVVNYPERVNRLPLMPDYVEGVFNLRDTIVPLINLRSILRLPAGEAETSHRYVGIVRVDGQQVGIALDRTGDVIPMNDEELAKVERKKGDNIISGLANLEGGQRIIRIIAASSIVQLEDIPMLSQTVRDDRVVSDFGAMLGGIGSGNTAISFTSEGSEFAIPVSDILEVLENPKLEDTHVAYDNCLGILNLRGAMISVIDFRTAMGSVSHTSIDTGMVIVVIADHRHCGFLVDSVTDVFDFHESRIIPIPQLKDNKRKGCLKGVVPISKERDVFLVDPKTLCDEEDILEAIEASSVPDALAGEDMGAGRSLTGNASGAGQGGLKVYITFKLSKTLAVEITEVDEIIAYPDSLMEPPGYDGYIRGMLNLRGGIIPIVDMRKYYSMSDYKDIESCSVLIVSRNGARYGLIVDSVEDSVDVYESQMTVIPKVMNDSANAEYQGDVSRIIEYTSIEGRKNTLMVYSVASFLKTLVGSAVA